MTDTNDLEPVNEKSELDSLKQTADNAGIKYSPNIGLDTLRNKVNEKLAPKADAAPLSAGAEILMRNDRIRKEATKLIRVRITNLNPNKKHSEGEFFRTGNSIIATIGRFVPFEHETHVESMLLTLIKNRQYAIVQEKKNADGHLVPIRGMRNEFQVEILTPLTQKDLDKLAIEQSKRQA